MELIKKDLGIIKDEIWSNPAYSDLYKRTKMEIFEYYIDYNDYLYYVDFLEQLYNGKAGEHTLSYIEDIIFQIKSYPFYEDDISARYLVEEVGPTLKLN